MTETRREPSRKLGFTASVFLMDMHTCQGGKRKREREREKEGSL
jgi:hypothetical protein